MAVFHVWKDDVNPTIITTTNTGIKKKSSDISIREGYVESHSAALIQINGKEINPAQTTIF